MAVGGARGGGFFAPPFVLLLPVVAHEQGYGVGVVRRVPVVLCIDIEPDPRQINLAAPEPWLSYDRTHAFLAAFRARAESVTRAPAHFSWFLRMDRQIAEPYGSATWIVDRHGDRIADAERRGDALGVHPHPYRWRADEQTWLQDYADQAWVDDCLAMSLEAFRCALGRPCRLLRFGDHWLNTATVNLAERLGIEYDLTIEPGREAGDRPARERLSGAFPDYRRVPRAPYVPAESDFRRPRRTPGRTIRMIPLSAGHLRLGLQPRALLRRLRGNGLRHWRQDTTLSLWRDWSAPDGFADMIGRALAAQRRRPYLAIAMRTDGEPELRANVQRCLDTLLAHPAAPRFVFCTPGEALAMLEEPAVSAPAHGRASAVA